MVTKVPAFRPAHWESSGSTYNEVTSICSPRIWLRGWESDPPQEGYEPSQPTRVIPRVNVGSLARVRTWTGRSKICRATVTPRGNGPVGRNCTCTCRRRLIYSQVSSYLLNHGKSEGNWRTRLCLVLYQLSYRAVVAQVGLEPTTTRLWIEVTSFCSPQYLVDPTGFAPAASWLQTRRSPD